jgi:orotate phosphoribosyltransferase
MKQYKKKFITAALNNNVLKFGEFTLKSGRKSPYFFNTGEFNTGSALELLGNAYADAIIDSDLKFELLFGPAYKGIPLASAVAISLFNKHGIDTEFCFNRKEKKDHGEGGVTFGANLNGRALIIDDVISAGTSVRESHSLISNNGAKLAGVCVALDRQERGASNLSAVQEVAAAYDVPVISIVSLSDIIAFVEKAGDYVENLGAINKYRDEYGV